MISPNASRELQKKIDEVTEAAKKDPALQAKLDEAVAAARKTTDQANAAHMCGPGYVGTLYAELLKRGLIPKTA